jgi:hypothetical protein
VRVGGLLSGSLESFLLLSFVMHHSFINIGCRFGHYVTDRQLSELLLNLLDSWICSLEGMTSTALCSHDGGSPILTDHDLVTCAKVLEHMSRQTSLIGTY